MTPPAYAPVLAGARLVAFVPVSDVERAARFYGQVLGLPVIEVTPFAAVVDAAGTSVRLVPVGHHVAAGWTVLGWAVDDLGCVVADLARSGVTMRRYDGMDQDPVGVWTSPDGARVAWFDDPDGNILSVTELG